MIHLADASLPFRDPLTPGGRQPARLDAAPSLPLPAPLLRRLLLLSLFMVGIGSSPAAVFNVRDHGASGRKEEDARPAIQKAIDACAAGQGGTVLLPPGEYTSGTLRLRSHVRIEIAAGATLFASTNPAAYDYDRIVAQSALFRGENLEDVAIEGAGTVDGQAAYEWREDDFERGYSHMESMQRLGRSLLRSFPQGFPKRQIFPRLVWLAGSKHIRFHGLRWLHSPSWTFNLYACEQVRFEDLYVHTSLKEGVWADGIDLDGCRDVTITGCRIETGDDCIIFISSNVWGPALPCENIRVSRCLLSSASAAVKFSEGNWAGVRDVWVSDCVLTNVNRGFVFSTTQGGEIRDVVLSNLTIHCRRFDWFWAGDGQPFYFRSTRLSEFTREPAKPGELPPGIIRNIALRNITAEAKGSSRFHGHPEGWLDGLSLENVRVTLSADPSAPFDYATNILDFRRARNVRVNGLETAWAGPGLAAWQSALFCEEVQGLEVNGFTGRGAPGGDRPAVVLNVVERALLQGARAEAGTAVFVQVSGAGGRDIAIRSNDLRSARVPLRVGPEVPEGRVRMQGNRMPGAGER